MLGTLYRIYNTKNNKSYIGKTYSCVYSRLNTHIKDSKKHLQRPLYRAFNKYGLEAFSMEILGEYEEGILEDEEINAIRKYKSYGSTGYNATLGGDGKRYLDIDTEVLKLYSNYNNSRKVADILSIDVRTCSKILKRYGITLSASKALRQDSNSVLFVEINEVFNSPTDLAEFLIECEISNTSILNLRNIITSVCRGSKPRYKGYTFKYIDIEKAM